MNTLTALDFLEAGHGALWCCLPLEEIVQCAVSGVKDA